MAMGEFLRRQMRSWVGELRGDLAAALALAAIAIPSQMGASHLAGFPPSSGLVAFVAATAGFAVLGANRFLIACADSTIAPIFAGGLAAIAAIGSGHYFVLASAFALMVGSGLLCIGLFRLGFLADLVSIPVTAGFLAGIAAHIAISQLPYLFGMAEPERGPLFATLTKTLSHPEAINPVSTALGLGVLGTIVTAELISPILPGALFGLMAATAAVYCFSLEQAGIAVLGEVPAWLPHAGLPAAAFHDLATAAPLALIIIAIIMVQTAATSRSFNGSPGETVVLDRDFAGVGAANIVAGFLGVFPVDVSPPLSETAADFGRRSKVPALGAALIVLAVTIFGRAFLARVPLAGIAGVLIFVAIKLVRVHEMAAIFRCSLGEFLLIIATFAAIVALPIGTGVAIAIVLSLLHGIWSMTRARLITFERVPGTTIWWPPGRGHKGETMEGVLVVAFQAPLSFLNAYDFEEDARRIIRQSPAPPKLIVLEASSIVEVDYTAATVLLAFIKECRQANIAFAIARLESLRAQEAFKRFGILGAVPSEHIFHSVDEAITALLKKTNEIRQNPV